MNDLYITTSIPYVNGAPHLGHALELVHVDALARHRRRRGADVRVQSGTDDHAIKNVSAADSAGLGVAELVAANGDRFADLAAALGVHVDEFLRTSTDPRHAAAVTTLWAACHKAGDLYKKDYIGLYCPGCEQFYAASELVDGICAEHQTPVVEVIETNWFFRLSRYREQITELVNSGRLDITPVERRNEVLGFLAGDVHDLSVSRPSARAAGWGISVPHDPEQIVYVWFDALTNYLTGLGYGRTSAAAYKRWWAGDTDRVHVIGKGIVRFHAVYWIAFLLSAGLPLPSRLVVHDYLTVAGSKIAKSGAQAADPATLVDSYGGDALRWWLLADPAPVGTTDFTEKRLVAAYNRDLANTLGNLASRALTLSRREGAWRTTPVVGVGDHLRAQAAALPEAVDSAVGRYDFRAACEAITAVADAGNRFMKLRRRGNRQRLRPPATPRPLKGSRPLSPLFSPPAAPRLMSCPRLSLMGQRGLGPSSKVPLPTLRTHSRESRTSTRQFRRCSGCNPSTGAAQFRACRCICSTLRPQHRRYRRRPPRCPPPRSRCTVRHQAARDRPQGLASSTLTTI